MTEWQPTACILCSRNCGIEVQIEEGHLTRIRGDEKHPNSQGYLCQKAARLDYYQNHADRLDTPLRRRADGSFEAVSWAVAIAEIAAKFKQLRDTHSGRSLAVYGGGGQGNHLGGVYNTAFRAALRTRYYYTSLAQEKTGDAWVNGKLFGRQNCHITEDVEHADYVVFWGTNPWQAHGIRAARDVLREVHKDPQRTMVVVDPRRTETADLADVHLQLKPGSDAYLLLAILGVIVQEGLADEAFIAERTTGWASVRERLRGVPVADFAEYADVPLDQVQRVARGLAKAKAASFRVDLGLQQTLNSTLNSYLEKLVWLSTGHFGREGTNGFHSWFAPLAGHSDFERDTPQSTLSKAAKFLRNFTEPGQVGDLLDDDQRPWRTTVTGVPEIGKMFPPNVLPAEIDTDHPQRIRGMLVDSANPILSGADTPAYLRAFEKLELLVVIDVAMTETAKHAHYVLPASSQLEKWEATFFNLDFPTNHFHLRAPLLPPRPGTLAEPEIYRRLLVAMGEIPERFPTLERVAALDRRAPNGLRGGAFMAAFGAWSALNPKLMRYAPVVMMQTLGKALPDGAGAAAPLWMLSHLYARHNRAAMNRAGIPGSGLALGEALFDRIMQKRSGTLLSTHEWSDTWRFLRHGDKRIHLEIPELLEQVTAIVAAGLPATSDEAYPIVLVAGERRTYNANTIMREPAWRRNDPDGALRMHPTDAAALGLADGDSARCESLHGAVDVRIKHCDTVRPGMATLPNGYGMNAPGPGGAIRGANTNSLTTAGHCDPIAKTPYHKHVRVRVVPLA